LEKIFKQNKIIYFFFIFSKSTQTSIRHLISEEECPMRIKTTTTSVLIVQESYLEEKENAKIVEDENLGSNFQEGCVNEDSMNELEQIRFEIRLF